MSFAKTEKYHLTIGNCENEYNRSILQENNVIHLGYNYIYLMKHFSGIN